MLWEIYYGETEVETIGHHFLDVYDNYRVL